MHVCHRTSADPGAMCWMVSGSEHEPMPLPLPSTNEKRSTGSILTGSWAAAPENTGPGSVTKKAWIATHQALDRAERIVWSGSRAVWGLERSATRHQASQPCRDHTVLSQPKPHPSPTTPTTPSQPVPTPLPRIESN